METDRLTASPILLLVEDDPNDVELAKIALTRSKIAHRLVVARDGQEALDYLLGQGTGAGGDRRESPTVIIMDFKMPRVSGREVLRRLREREGTRRIPVVILSSSVDKRDLADCYTLGANSYFRKPVDFGEFTDGVSVLLNYWLVANTPAQEGYEVRPAGDIVLSPHLLPAPSMGALTVTGAQLADIQGGRRAPVVIVDPDAEARQRTVEALAPFVRTGEPIGSAETYDEAAAFLLSEQVCGGSNPWACPHLAVLDLGVDPVRGLAALRYIRSRVDHRLIVVVYTANADPAFVSACYGAEASSFVVKPADLTDYRNVVRLLGFYWLKLNVSPPARTIPQPASM